MKFFKKNMQCIVPKRFMTFFALMLVGNVLFAQLNITGKVVNKTGQPISGANVAIKGTNISASTLSNGTFAITGVSSDASVQLEISAANYKSATQTVNSTASDVVVTLQTDIASLDEIIVTGTGTGVKKRQLVNSVAVVSAKDLQNSGAQSIDAAMQGKVAGAQINQNSGNPAGGISVRLRGPSTIAGSSEPLYIIDGVIVNNDSRALLDLGGGSQNRLVDLNMNDVERIEIIKGAAAAAIYGSRASNGVVQIFTKKGKDGAPQFNFTTSYRTSSIRKKLEINKVPFKFAFPTNLTDVTTVPVTRYDLQDLIFRNASGTENNLSVSGGGAGTKYYVSASNFYNQGIIRASDFNRNGLRLKLNQKAGNKATFNVGANYVVSESNEVPNGGLAEAYGALTGFIFAPNDINPVKNPVTGIFPTLDNGVVARTNPLEVIDRYKFKQRTNRIVTDVNFNYKPFDGFIIDLTSGFDSYTQTATGYIPPGNTTGTYNTGFSRRSDATVFQTNTDLNLSYTKKLNSWLQSTTIAGGTMQYEKTISFAANAISLGLFGQTIDNGIAIASEFRSERSIRGAFLQQNFAINNNFFVNAAGRFDGSSVFSTKYASQFYPKLGASYIVSNEKFWQGIENVVSFFKVRAAWGKSGNVTGIGPYDRFNNYSPNSYGSQIGYIPSNARGNVFVKPETQVEFEFGIDANLFKDRVTVELNFFNKKVQDLLINKPLSLTTGFNNNFANVGNLSNKGIEFLIKAIAVRTKNIEWETSVSYLGNKNKVTDIPTFDGTVILGGFDRVAAINDQQLGVFYSSFFAKKPDGSLLLTAAGLPQVEKGTQGANGTYTVLRGTDPLNVVTFGQPIGATLNKVIGNPLPKHIVSFINTIKIKRLTVKMQWDGQYGFDIFNFTKRVGSRFSYGGLKTYEPELKGLVPKGTSSALFGIFENWIEKGDFTKLRELSFAYQFPGKLWKFKNASVILAGRNLVAITPYSGFDPETNTAGQSNGVRSFDFNEVPIPKSYSLTFNLNF
jgi:TonB-dependent starch-binding outer membrane protein SusC